MSNQNGQLIVETLQELEKPATVLTISKQIADTVGAELSEVKQSVQSTLDAGVRYGFIQCANQKYFTAPLDLAEMQEAELAESANNSNEMQDRVRRRRKSTGRRRKRRVGSRRRRRH